MWLARRMDQLPLTSQLEKGTWSAFRCSEGHCASEADVEVDMVESHSDYQYSDTFGFGMVTFANATHMQYRNIPVTGTIGYDEFWIVKNEEE